LAVATEREWRDLSIHTAVFHLKEKGYEHWKYSDKVASATNETGFTALPGGSRGISNKTFLLNFADLGIDAIWWNPAEYEYKETAAKIIILSMTKRISSLSMSCPNKRLLYPLNKKLNKKASWLFRRYFLSH
jgi:hypothetical protein